MVMSGINYKKELEAASRVMVRIQDHILLGKLLARMIVRKVGLVHAAMIFYEPARDDYVLSVSRGEMGDRIPERFIRFDRQHPLIRVFLQKEFKYLASHRRALVADDINTLIWRESVIEGEDGSRDLLHQVSEQFPMLNSVAGIPAFYQQELLAVILLGRKKNGEKIGQEELDFLAALASDLSMAVRHTLLSENLRNEAGRGRNLFIQTAIALGSAIEAKDSYTRGHTERVTKYAVAIARKMVAMKMIDVPSRFFENLYISSLLHDVGKIGVPEAILLKGGKLTSQEYDVMKTHPARGAEIVSAIKDFEGCVPGVRQHHEHYDGSGYPDGVSGEDISMVAAIISVADAYDAMTSDRPYRKGFSRERAIREIGEFSGVWFNPKAALAVWSLYEQGEI